MRNDRTIRHYANQAHHAPGEGGIANYTRTEARLILTFSETLFNWLIEGT